MFIKLGYFAVLGATPLVLLSAVAWSDGLTVNVTNDGTEDIQVTVYDTSVGPKAMVLSQRVTGFTTVPVTVSQDATGRANLAWTAVTIDPNNRKCGHADRTGLSDAASVHVRADADCRPDQPAAALTSFEE
jgi:hypothetical protein